MQDVKFRTASTTYNDYCFQEKDWDTMLDILQTNAEFYPKVLDMFTELITVKELNQLLEEKLIMKHNNMLNIPA